MGSMLRLTLFGGTRSPRSGTTLNEVCDGQSSIIRQQTALLRHLSQLPF